jgi:hypothetical protein
VEALGCAAVAVSCDDVVVDNGSGGRLWSMMVKK